MEQGLSDLRLYRLTPIEEFYKVPSAYLLAPHLCLWVDTIAEARAFLETLEREFPQFAGTYRVGEYRYEEVDLKHERASITRNDIYYRVSHPQDNTFMLGRNAGAFLFTKTGKFFEDYTGIAVFFPKLKEQAPGYRVHGYRIRHIDWKDKLNTLNELIK